MESIGYGIYRQPGDWAGRTVAEVRQALEPLWTMPSDAVAYCGNLALSDTVVVPRGAIIEFHRRSQVPDLGPATKPCTECGVAVAVDGADTYIYVASDPLMYYCGPCWRHMRSPENRDEVVAELIEILASAALPAATADEPVVAADPA